MRRGIISWNGERSDQYGIYVEKYPNFQKPLRKFDKYTVPGRNGDIIMMQDAWENVEQKYDIFAGNGEKHSVPDSFSHVADWLYSPNGYCELWDDFDPTHFRLAYVSEQINVDSLSIGRVGRATLTFNCKPQRFLMSGKNQIEIHATPFTVYNPTAFAAKPLIFVERSAAGSGTVSVNGTIFTITDLPEYGLFIDCEKLNCTDINGNNMNSIVSSNTNKFATLDAGQNAIGSTGNVSTMTITPRWFEL